jgi:hypothetical protein
MPPDVELSFSSSETFEGITRSQKKEKKEGTNSFWILIEKKVQCAQV